MPTSYPTGLDDFLNPAAGSPTTNPSHAGLHSSTNDAIEAIEAELGLSPSGASATVAARLDASEVLRGSSFPAQPAYGNNRPFYRTDLGMAFFYDGTLWLSDTLYSFQYGPVGPISASGTNVVLPTLGLPYAGDRSIYCESMQVTFSVAGGGTALGASHSWAVQVNATPADSAVGYVLVNSGASAGTVRVQSAVNGSPLAVNKVYAYLMTTKVGTPGDITIHSAIIHYRLVAT